MRAQDKGRNKNDFGGMVDLSYAGDHTTVTKHVCRSEESDGGKGCYGQIWLARSMGALV
jgi:hypothetical protein